MDIVMLCTFFLALFPLYIALSDEFSVTFYPSYIALKGNIQK